jgi:hypothetical protein
VIDLATHEPKRVENNPVQEKGKRERAEDMALALELDLDVEEVSVRSWEEERRQYVG